ncbi:hypothetical protein LCGC14_2267310 [marine sediment metagenome]|uniref:Uncharacterized protein n=1 Tax=marine sediment metagenome TaxID=412755 RepID=A0A0F9FAD7_9ZZZZ
MNIGNKIMLGVIWSCMFVVGYIMYDEAVNTRSVCYEEGVVLDILKVHYRDATILTDKGEVILNQATVKDGDTICLRSGRERIDNEK